MVSLVFSHNATAIKFIDPKLVLSSIFAGLLFFSDMAYGNRVQEGCVEE